MELVVEDIDECSLFLSPVFFYDFEEAGTSSCLLSHASLFVIGAMDAISQMTLGCPCTAVFYKSCALNPQPVDAFATRSSLSLRPKHLGEPTG
jgi:hypothetical protein